MFPAVENNQHDHDNYYNKRERRAFNSESCIIEEVAFSPALEPENRVRQDITAVWQAQDNILRELHSTLKGWRLRAQ